MESWTQTDNSSTWEDYRLCEYLCQTFGGQQIE